MAGFPPAMGLVGRPVVAEQPPALDPLTVEPGHRSAQEAHRGRPLLVGQHLDIRQAGGVIDGHMHLLVASAGGASFAWITGGPVPNTVEPGQLFDVDMDHVAGPLPLVAPHRRLGFQILEPSQPQGVHHPSDGREGRLEGLGDAAERAALVP